MAPRLSLSAPAPTSLLIDYKQTNNIWPPRRWRRRLPSLEIHQEESHPPVEVPPPQVPADAGSQTNGLIQKTKNTLLVDSPSHKAQRPRWREDVSASQRRPAFNRTTTVMQRELNSAQGKQLRPFPKTIVCLQNKFESVWSLDSCKK